MIDPLNERAWEGLFYKKCLGWEFKFAFLPKRCNITGKKIWLEYGYRGEAWFRFGDHMDREVRWHNKIEHIVWKLKR